MTAGQVVLAHIVPAAVVLLIAVVVVLRVRSFDRALGFLLGVMVLIFGIVAHGALVTTGILW